MENKRNATEVTVDPAVHPLKTLTEAQFAALGGTAVVFTRAIGGIELTGIIDESGFEDDEVYHLVMSADGTPMFVSDTAEAVTDWLAETGHGVVQLH